MAAIRLAANYISETDTDLLPPGLRDSGHLQIVFDDGDPATRLIEAEVNAPDLLFAGDWVYAPFGQPHGAPTDYISDDDVVEDAERYRAVDLSLRPFQSPEKVWDMLAGVHGALEASGADIDYDIDQNSNSYARTALYTVGIDLDDYLEDVRPADVQQFPGAATNVLLGAKTGPTDSDDVPIPLDLTDDNGGTDAGDFIRTGIGDDTIKGAEGDDIIEGGGGDDRIDGGDGTDTSLYRGAFGEYTIEFLLDGSARITDSIADRDGADILVEFEKAWFSDRVVDLEGADPPADPVPVRISFKGGDAGFANAFGIYDTSTMTAELLAPDLNATNEDAVLYEADLTRAQLDTLGFFLVPDGGDANADLASLVGEELMVVNTAGGYAVSAAGTPLAGVGAPALFSDASLNPGGLDHFVEDGTPAAHGLSVEDLAGGGDLDFDDALFLVEAGVPMTAANVTVTFESASADFHNTFGYFIEGTDEAGILFADLHETTLAPGATETFALTAEAYKRLEFFLIPDGATNNAGLFSDLDAIDLIIEDTGDGLRARDEATGTVLEGEVNPVYAPGTPGISEPTRHALKIGDVDDFELRWEDRPDGDKDYNDALIGVQITPDEILV